MIVVAYGLVPWFNQILAQLALLKNSSGLVYSFFSTALFGGLIPWLVLFAGRPAVYPGKLKTLIFYLLFWGVKGMEIDLFYRLQSLLFGSGNDLAIIVKKVVVDQFIYNPLWAVPSQVIAYQFLAKGFSISALHNYNWREFFTRKVPLTTISTWVVWIPMVSIVYCLPPDLQIPLFNLVLCFWVLMVAVLSKEKDSTPLELS